MPNVQLPDNSVVQFPDDMQEADINSAIHQHLYGNEPIPNAAESFIDKASGMMTFGLDKPITSAMLAATSKGGEAIKGLFTGQSSDNYGDLYDKYQTQQNNREALESENHPVASGLGDAAGFVGSMATMLPKAGAAATAVLPGAWNTVKTLGASARNNALISAGIGEANAIGSTSGSAQDKIAAAYPAGVGSAAIGAALPIVAQGITSGVSKLASTIIDRLTASDSETAIAKLAKRFAQDSNITPEQTQTVLENLGPNASLADVGGANVQKLGKTILNTPSKGANDTTNFLLGRQRGMGPRVQDIVKTGFGNNAEFNDTIANLQAAQQEQAAPLYQKAFVANQSMQSPMIDRVLKTPAGQSALKAAAIKMQNDMSLMGVNDPALMEQAQLAGQYTPSSGGISSGLKLRTLDYVKRALDDQIGTAQRTGENDNVRILSGLKNNFVKALDSADQTATKNSPGLYAQGRSAYSGGAKSLEALEMGRNFMNEDSQVTAKDVSNLDPGDKHFFQIGAARALSDKAAANPANTIKNIISNDLWKQRLQAAMPSQDHYYDFLTNAQNEATMQATKNAVLGNSSTASQLKDMAEENGQSIKMPYDLNVGNIIDASQGDLKGTMLQIGKHYANKAMAPKPAVADQLGQMMFSNNPQQNTKTIQAWQKYLTPQTSIPFAISPQLNPFGWQAARLSYGGQTPYE